MFFRNVCRAWDHTLAGGLALLGPGYAARTSPFGDSPKFNYRLTEFSKVGSGRLSGAQESFLAVIGGSARRSASNAAKGVVPLVSGSTDRRRLPPPLGLQEALPTLTLSLLPEPSQLYFGMLQPGLHPQLYLVAHRPETLKHGVVGDLLLAAGIVEDPGEGGGHPRGGFWAFLLGAGA